MNCDPMNRIVATPIRAVRFDEVWSHSPCTELPPSGLGVAVRVMKLPGACASLSTTVSVTEFGSDQS